jgi:poly(3-hydroxybutyrate) depolymerase
MMDMPMRVSFLPLLLAAAGTLSAAGRYVEITYPPSTQPSELQFGVTYTLWIPGGAAKLRGVIVHQHGCGVGAAKGGQTAAYDLHWQALAKKWNMALLGPAYLVEREEQGCGWSVAAAGSGKSFVKALGELAVKSNRPELETVPWALWGHSGGGTWAGGMQQLYPERIAAIWFRSGSVQPSATTPEAAYGIPMIANTGVKEKTDRFARAWTGSLATFHGYRAKGAPIAFTPDPRTSHECGDSRYLAILFFDACFRLRLPAKGNHLRPIGTSGVKLPAVMADTADTVWLPDTRVARAWAEYVRTGEVGDSTPPPAPAQVKAARVNPQSVELTWDAEADFESGIQAFLILRDGKQIAQLPEKPVGKYGRPLFQALSFHDTPERPLPEMKFVDKAEGRHMYRVFTVNSVGLKSKPSKPAQVLR